jgi:hypothetical protein
VNRFAGLLAAVLLGLAAPSPATAQLGPTNVPTPLTQTDDSQPAAAPVEEDNGLSTWQLVLMLGAAAGVVAVIAWVIMRDAHRAAPAPARGTSEPVAAKKSAREREREQARKRSKAKAAREQRKRNRPR